MKKGFVFTETLIVLVVLLVTVVLMFGMYAKVTTDINARKYFDNVSDLYKTDILRSLFNRETLPSNSYTLISSSNCANYMDASCTSIFESLNVENIYINNGNVDSLLLSETDLNNSMREYLKTINNTYDRLIIVNFNYNSKNYYASLKI